MRAQVHIRQASPHEMAQVIAFADDAFELYKTAGLHINIGREHPFALAEVSRWSQAAQDGGVYFAEADDIGPVGLLVVNFVDGARYVDQLSVLRSAMRRGIGRTLLRHAIQWAGADPLWLTTYSHLPWNRPFYETEGFAVVPEAECPHGIIELVEEQRRWLPAPEERIAMRRTVSQTISTSK